MTYRSETDEIVPVPKLDGSDSEVTELDNSDIPEIFNINWNTMRMTESEKSGKETTPDKKDMNQNGEVVEKKVINSSAAVELKEKSESGDTHSLSTQIEESCTTYMKQHSVDTKRKNEMSELYALICALDRMLLVIFIILTIVTVVVIFCTSL